MKRMTFVLGLLVPGLLGCSVLSSSANGLFNHALEDSLTKNTPPAPAAAPNHAAEPAPVVMAPQMTQFYMQFAFAMAFSQGGYALDQDLYKPGQWTRWSLPQEGRTSQKHGNLERAYLFDDGDGAWWKIKWVLEDAKPEENTLILEALFNKKDHTLRRLRGKMPYEKEAKELPVTAQTYYQPPMQLTAESVKGATKGMESVTVPAGTFKAKHVVYGNATGGSVEWYLVDSVPGGCVKVINSGGQEDRGSYVMDLMATGSDAKSELGTVKP